MAGEVFTGLARHPRRSALLAGVGLVGLVHTSGARAQSLAPPPTDVAARVQSLEGEVRALTDELHAMRAQLQALTGSAVAAQARAAPIQSSPSPAAKGDATQGGSDRSAMTAVAVARQGAPPRGAVVASETPPAAEAETPSSAGSAGIPGVPSTATGRAGVQAPPAQQAAAQAGVAPAEPYTVYAGGTPTTAAVAAIEGGRPVIESADGLFTVNLLGVMHMDAADYMQETPGPLSTDFRRGGAALDTARARDLSSGSNFRRARLGLGGKAFGDFQYSFLYEFGGSGGEDAGHVQELWVQYSGVKPFFLRVGAFAPFIGLEDAGSTNGMLFLERPSVSETARSLAGADYREALQLIADTGRVFVSGAVTGRLVTTANGTASASAAPYDSQLGVVGRAAILPIRTKTDTLHLGIHGSYVITPADATGPDGAANAVRYAIELRDRPELRVDGTRLIDTGAIDARHAATAGLEFAAQHGPLMLQSEAEYFHIERRQSPLSNPDFFGYYVEGSWVLTGEARRYNAGNFAFDGPRVAHNFDLKKGAFGSFELALRYSRIDLNFEPGAPGTNPLPGAVRGGEQTVLSAGLNWYLNPVVRMMLDWDYVHIDRLSPSATAFGTPAGAQVGQSYNVPAARMQMAF